MRKGQNTLEYTVVVIAVVAALLAMHIYLKRAMQGRLRSAADETGQQYAPQNTASDIAIQQNSEVVIENITVKDDDTGTYKTKSISTIKNQTDTRQGSEKVGPLPTS